MKTALSIVLIAVACVGCSLNMALNFEPGIAHISHDGYNLKVMLPGEPAYESKASTKRFKHRLDDWEAEVTHICGDNFGLSDTFMVNYAPQDPKIEGAWETYLEHLEDTFLTSRDDESSTQLTLRTDVGKHETWILHVERDLTLTVATANQTNFEQQAKYLVVVQVDERIALLIVMSELASPSLYLEHLEIEKDPSFNSETRTARNEPGPPSW